MIPVCSHLPPREAEVLARQFGLDTTRNTFRDKAKSGALPALRLDGGRFLLETRALIAWLEAERAARDAPDKPAAKRGAKLLELEACHAA